MIVTRTSDSALSRYACVINAIIERNQTELWHLLRAVTVHLPFHPRQEFPELDGMSHGNSNDTPADAYRAVLGVSSGLEQLNANVGQSHMNEEPKSCDFQ